MREDSVAAWLKLTRARKLLEEQQDRVHRQRELIARLENKATDFTLLRSARESLRQLIKTQDAIMREVAAAQESADIRLREQ
jgi:anionic cell wall polymer biosynthesis LytR-Cps2A-Psr (LCP) family protein